MNAIPREEYEAPPPHSVEAEQSVLGAILLGAPVPANIVADDFYRADHRVIRTAIDALTHAGKSCDVVLVFEQLERTGDVDNAGGLAYLRKLAAETPTATNIEQYAEVVRERARLRRLRSLGSNINRAITDGASAVQIAQGLQPVLDTFVQTAAPTNADPFSWLEEHQMTDTEAQEISDPTWIEPGFIVESHLIAIVAKPNGGKTTIIFELACKWAQRGYNVAYVHADTNPADAKRMREKALQHDVRYLTPDLKVGKSMLNVVEELDRMAESPADLAGWVFIFDTLKKMTNVIQKAALRDLLMLLRKLSSRGMTVIVLAHTNKYKNAEGEYQYEGTGDLEADVDELVYFEPRENPDGTLTVSTRCGKRRAHLQPMTWDIGSPPDLIVTRRTEYVDVHGETHKAKQQEKDAPVIEAITECLEAGPKKQSEVIQHCKSIASERRVRPVLMRYSGELWKAEKLFQKNAWRYELIRSEPESRV